MTKREANTILKNMVKGLDDDDGVNEAMYTAIIRFTFLAYNKEMVKRLSKYVKCTNDKFYIKEKNVKHVLKEMSK